MLFDFREDEQLKSQNGNVQYFKQIKPFFNSVIFIDLVSIRPFGASIIFYSKITKQCLGLSDRTTKMLFKEV